uniref:Uncharacterized protein n=1 Tax=Romanomermis culicivorax TaxID=13658 RepID=A0A915HTC0_ROMCU
MLSRLIVSLIFVVSAVAYNHHPEYVNCQLAGAENLTVIYANETWQQCKDKKLEILCCVTDLDEKPLDLTSPQNELCHMKFHKALYIDDTGSVYGCKNGQFEIRSCMINFQEKFKCVPKEKFSASQWNIKNFCKNFAASPATYLPNYQAALKECNAGL